ncbi:hypothetical protein OIO90_004204 [Microbotryomycetes sp. JL221]|nr:hypothetical protein OIO90_004204 [Microbotryomycetes sp. JL221]
MAPHIPAGVQANVLTRRQQQVASNGVTITAPRGNFMKTNSNYSCDPVTATWSGVTPPATISLYSGVNLPQDFFTNRPTTQSGDNEPLNLVQQITIVNASSGSFDWSINVNVGSYVGLAIVDSQGQLGFSELRTVYDGSRGDPTCRAVIDDPTLDARNYTLPAVGSFDTNVYLATDDIPRCDMPVQYSVAYKPAKIQVVNVTGLPQRFFQGDWDNVDTTVIAQVADDIQYTMGQIGWTPNVPVGSRIAWKVTDGQGQVGYSEARTVYYPASNNSKALCEYLNEVLSEDDHSGHEMSNAAKYGIGFLILMAITVIVVLFSVCRRRRRQAQFVQTSPSRMFGRRKTQDTLAKDTTVTRTSTTTNNETNVMPEMGSTPPTRPASVLTRTSVRTRSTEISEPLPRYEPKPPGYDTIDEENNAGQR